MASMEIKKAEQVTKTYANDQKYVGEFKDGKMNGQGTHSWPDGKKYVGEFKDGKMNGQGTKYRSDGSVEYKGQWLNNQPVGR